MRIALKHGMQSKADLSRLLVEKKTDEVVTIDMRYYRFISSFVGIRLIGISQLSLFDAKRLIFLSRE